MATKTPFMDAYFEKLQQDAHAKAVSDLEALKASPGSLVRITPEELRRERQDMEAEIKAAGADKFPRITPQDIEADPNGKKPNESGAKLDAGKNRLGLVLCGFARALQAVGEVGTYGANKYTDNGWVEVPDGERRYTDAMLRHLLRESTGEERDPDTGLPHAAHVAWNALARLDLALREKLAQPQTYEPE